MNPLEMLEEKLKTQSIMSIIKEINEAEKLSESLYGELFKTIKNNIYEFDNVKYIVNEINQHGIVFLNRIICELNSGEYICGGLGYRIHIEELLNNEIT